MSEPRPVITPPTYPVAPPALSRWRYIEEDPDAGTSFPSSPSDGDIFIYNADTTNGIKWMFQYRAASASNFKWEFIGGGSLFSRILTDETFADDGIFHSLTTPDVLTAPLAGEYVTRWNCNVYSDGAAMTAISGGPGIGASDPVVGFYANTFTNAANAQTILSGEVPFTGAAALAAGNTLTLRFLTPAAAGSPHVRWRNFFLVPIRVG